MLNQLRIVLLASKKASEW